MIFVLHYQVGTWCLYNVVSTSTQGYDVAATLRRPCIDVMCLLGIDQERSLQDIDIADTLPCAFWDSTHIRGLIKEYLVIILR